MFYFWMWEEEKNSFQAFKAAISLLDPVSHINWNKWGK